MILLKTRIWPRLANPINYAAVFVTTFSLLMTQSVTALEQTFDQDLARLNKHFSPIVLTDQKRSIAILTELQGRIMNATVGDKSNASIGWIDRDHLDQDKVKSSSLAGGIDRLWFGPDGGKFSVFFEPGVETAPENIRPPQAITNDPFELKTKTGNSATFEKQLTLTNHLGFKFDAEVTRKISIFNQNEVEEKLGIDIPDHLNWVGYGSENTVQNTSKTAWTAENGLFSIWTLGMFEATATVVIPLTKPLKRATNYFVPPSDQQVNIVGNTLFYKADADFMNKIGVPPEYTMPVMGSYNEKRKLLTLVLFSITPDSKYVNAVWDWQAPPLEGEIINIFNDGIQENGERFGPFYEMETSSMALSLLPGQRHSHTHQTFHFIGDDEHLNTITEDLLQTSIEEIKNAF